MLRKAFILVEPAWWQFSDDDLTIERGPGTSCRIQVMHPTFQGNQLYRDDHFVRNLTPEDQKQLAAYNAEVKKWDANLQLRIQHISCFLMFTQFCIIQVARNLNTQNNANENKLRESMNAVFGPGGTFEQAMKGIKNRPAPTMKPLLPAEETVPIPEMPFPNPPPFCRDGH
ncbi:unnamed protein product [Anisakis simplex]|uniref:Pepsin-I3 domain-containing protein n=1 Tax=Anisakis simplex TaxID=6269 RepID=A0A0M3KGJ4_ANISI|nr:unnamed protein product [Anisakis simplex]